MAGNCTKNLKSKGPRLSAREKKVQRREQSRQIKARQRSNMAAEQKAALRERERIRRRMLAENMTAKERADRKRRDRKKKQISRLKRTPQQTEVNKRHNREKESPYKPVWMSEFMEAHFVEAHNCGSTIITCHKCNALRDRNKKQNLGSEMTPQQSTTKKRPGIDKKIDGPMKATVCIITSLLHR